MQNFIVMELLHDLIQRFGFCRIKSCWHGKHLDKQSPSHWAGLKNGLVKEKTSHITLCGVFQCFHGNHNHTRSMLHQWRLGINKLFHPSFYDGCNYISMLVKEATGLKELAESFCSGSLLPCAHISPYKDLNIISNSMYRNSIVYMNSHWWQK